MTKGLRIAPQLTLPLEAVTEAMAILAVRRAGKSNAAVVMAEEMYDAGVPWVAVDPKGDWWGVRAAGSGNAPGLSVLVFGGLHGDLPLEPTGGNLVADLIVDQRITCVLDVSEMSKADQRRFLTAFASRLYKRNTEPLHVFCEEADEYLPQMVRGESAVLVGAFERLVKRGGFKGIGITLVTQRSASLNKDVLTQVGTLIAMRTPSPQDRKAILDWVSVHDAGREVVDELPSLKDGEAWVFSPQWLGVLKRVKFRRRRTFDSGETPKVGVKRRTPTRLADVDLAEIKEAMADTIERAKADDPKTLHRRIAELERDLSKRPEPVAPEPVRVEVPVISDEVVAKIEATFDRMSLAYTEWAEQLQQAVALTDESIEQINTLRAVLRTAATAPPTPVTEQPRRFVPPPVVSRPANMVTLTGDDTDASLSKAERRILNVLAQHGRLGTTQVAILTNYSHKSGGFRNALSKLRTRGFIDGRGDVAITDTGADALGPVEPLPTGADLRAWWMQEHLGKAEGAILAVLADHYPAAVDTATIAELTGYAPTSGGFRNSLSRLRSLQLASGRGELVMSDTLAG